MLRFAVNGIPAPKGSTRAFVVAGRARITNANAATKPWEQAVAHAAMVAMDGRPPMLGPVEVMLDFGLPRPKGHTNPRTGELRRAAPLHQTTKPDLDKLVRCVLDALTIAGAWRDDAQVSRITATKLYGPPGVNVVVYEAPLITEKERP